MPMAGNITQNVNRLLVSFPLGIKNAEKQGRHIQLQFFEENTGIVSTKSKSIAQSNFDVAFLGLTEGKI